MEKVNLPTLDTYHPLVMSVLELKWQAEGHVAFNKWDVFSSLKEAIPKARSQNAEASPEGAVTLPIASDIRTDNAILALSEWTSDDGAPPAEPTTLSTETNPPVSTQVLPKGEVMVPAAETDIDAPGDLMTPPRLLALSWQRTRSFLPPNQGTSWPSLPHLLTG